MAVVLQETLCGGALRLSGGAASFTITRVRPGVLSLLADGLDTGQFDTMVLTELSRELARFPIDHELFVDASQVAGVALVVRRAWADWLRSHRGRLRRIHMLATTRQMKLTAAVAGHDSGAKLLVYDAVEPFRSALRHAAGDWPSAPVSSDAVEVRTSKTQQGLVLDDGACRASFHNKVRGLLLLRLEGHDHGTLANAIFDVLVGALRDGGPLSLFIDLRDVTMPTSAVSELWASWFAAHRAQLQSVVLLATNRGVALSAGIARWRSHTGDLIRVLRDAQAFDKAMEQAASKRAGYRTKG